MPPHSELIQGIQLQKILEEVKPTIQKKILLCLQLTKRENTMENSLKSKKIKHENML